MNYLRLGILILVLPVVGCSHVPSPGDLYRIDPLIDYSSIQKDSSAQASQTGSSSRNGMAFTYQEIEKMENEVKAENTAGARNRYFETLLARSEAICGQHLADVAAAGGSVGFGTNLAATIFSALATANPGGAATSYAATSTVVNAGGAAFNANIYHGYITPAIVREIRKKREAFLQSQAVESFKAKSIEDASASGAQLLAIQFHESCSFYNGLIDVAAPNGSPPQKPPAVPPGGSVEPEGKKKS